MKVIVIGLGSMGKRRIRLLNMILKNVEIIGVDSRMDRQKQVQKDFSIFTVSDLDYALETFCPDSAIVCTSPLSHADIIEKCLLHDCNVFTELNLVKNKYETNIMLAKKRGKVLFLSSTFLYREEINFIKTEVLNTSKNINYIYHVGQYLPDWHPWEAISDYFVGDKKTNGCRELFAIELPWIINTFGNIKTHTVISSKNTNLPIHYNDNYLLTIEHTNGNKGVLAVDIMSRKAVRNLEIYGEDLHITWDGTPHGLKKYNLITNKEDTINLYDKIDSQEQYAKFIVENGYKNELISFFNQIEQKEISKYSFEDDIKILDFIDMIEGE